MKIFSLALLSIIVISPLSTSASPLPLIQTTTEIAPADHYFGHTKISILGIRNALNDLTNLVTQTSDATESVLHKAEFTEEALKDWATQYPLDPWLPKYTHNLVLLYSKCTGIEAKQHRLAIQDWLNEKFPDSQYAEAF